MKIKLLIFVIFLFITLPKSWAQLPADLSKVRSSQITDDQLYQFVQKAQSSGQTQEDILFELKQRGLPDNELMILSDRVSTLMGREGEVDVENIASPLSSRAKRQNTAMRRQSQLDESTSKVFGAELFSGASPLFVPNLNIATPLNYRVGPGDELLLEVYGNNVFNQKLPVSREGFVNIKYAGLINVNGKTIEDLSSLFKSKLSKFIPSLGVGASKLQVSLSNIRSITVSVVGAVKKPGTLTLPSLATLFNALYATGGPLENGSLRTIELIRGNKKIIEADLYEFLLKGDQSANIFLQDNDLIRVPFAQNQVQVSGLLNRTGIFEVKPSDNLSSLFDYAGGFKPLAYKGRVTGTRNGALTKEIIDIPYNSFPNFSLKHGDSLHVDSLVDKYINRVTIKGAVFKPGVYAWQNGQDLLEVINKAAGVKADALVANANVLRTYENLKKENIAVDLIAVLEGKLKFQLLNEDEITIYSTFELRDKYAVIINGPVRSPGSFLYADSLTLQQLILMAGGFTDRALPTSIEIGRNKKTGNTGGSEEKTVEIIQVKVNADLAATGADFLLAPNDIVSIKSDPSKIPQSKVLVTGKVQYPGTYVLESREDRLSSILKRAGGLLSYADENGVKVIRRNIVEDTASIKNTIEKQIKNKTDSAKSKDDKKQDFDVTEIAVNLAAVLKAPGTAEDIILEDGDEVVIPQIKNVVSLTGEVLKPVAVQFSPGKNIRYYITSAGGFSTNAKKSKTFVINSNGRSKRTASFLGIFKNYPKLSPGATVVVPAKPERTGKFDPAKAGILISALSALVSTIAILKGL